LESSIGSAAENGFREGESVNKVKIPWRAWYGDRDYKLPFPDEWDVQIYDHAGARALLPREIESGIDAPIGSPPLSDLASGCRTVTIAVDDLSRPTPAARLLPAVIDVSLLPGSSHATLTSSWPLAHTDRARGKTC
jgi:nickel-dependent lactate racemase